MTSFTRAASFLLLVASTLTENNFAFQTPSSRYAFNPSSRSITDHGASSAFFMSTTDEVQNDIFAPLKQFFSGPTKEKTVENDYDAPIAEAKLILNQAVESKSEDPELVLGALESLEKFMRKKAKAEPKTAAKEILNNLDGEWRLVFTTGTKDTQKKIGAKINYFPIKAMQSFQTNEEPMKIQNGIFLGDFAVIKFFGEFEFDLEKRKLEFDFDEITVLGFTIDLGKGKAAKIGAASGLGSNNNVELVAKDKKPFFNWISADGTIATARGGGGGIALWKRVVPEADM